MPAGSWAAHWNVGDTVNAAEMNKGVGAIFDSTLGVDTASFDVSGIVGSYAHLKIVAALRSTEAVGTSTVTIRFNNDSGANYDSQRTQGAATTISGAESFAQTGGLIGFAPGSTSPANNPSGIEILIPNYAGTTFNKAATGVLALYAGTTTGLLLTMQTAVGWRSTAAITRITLLPGGGANFKAGSRLTIYAMGA